MGIQSGMLLTPARLNVQRGSAQLATNYQLTATMDVLSGFSSLIFTTVTPNATFHATWSGDFQLTTAGAPTGVLSLSVDNVPVANPQAVWNPANVTTGARETEGQSHSGVLATPGTHTFSLRGQVTGTGAIRLNALHTQLTVVVFP